MGHASKHRLASLLACLSLSDTNNNNKRLCCFLVAYTSGPHLVPGADGAVFDRALLLQAEPPGPGCLCSVAPWRGGGVWEPLLGTRGREHAPWDICSGPIGSEITSQLAGA